MFHNEMVRNVLATVAAAGMVGGGGYAFQVGQKVDRHDIKISSMEKQQDDLLREIKTSNQELQAEVGKIQSDVGEIKTGVAVLKERTEHYENGKPRS